MFANLMDNRSGWLAKTSVCPRPKPLQLIATLDKSKIDKSLPSTTQDVARQCIKIINDARELVFPMATLTLKRLLRSTLFRRRGSRKCKVSCRALTKNCRTWGSRAWGSRSSATALASTSALRLMAGLPTPCTQIPRRRCRTWWRTKLLPRRQLVV